MPFLTGRPFCESIVRFGFHLPLKVAEHSFAGGQR